MWTTILGVRDNGKEGRAKRWQAFCEQHLHCRGQALESDHAACSKKNCYVSVWFVEENEALDTMREAAERVRGCMEQEGLEVYSVNEC